MDERSTPAVPGRPPLEPGERTFPVTVRLNARQRDKLRMLGGARWLRARLDEAAWPTRTISSLMDRESEGLPMTARDHNCRAATVDVGRRRGPVVDEPVTAASNGLD